MKASKMFLLSASFAFCFFFLFGVNLAHATNFVKSNGHGKPHPGPSGAPEPQMMYLMGMAGLAGIVFIRRKKIKEKAV